MDLDHVQHPDGKTYRLVSRLDDAEQERTRSMFRARRRLQRLREGLPPVPPETHGLPPGVQL